MHSWFKATVVGIILSGTVLAADWPQWRGTNRDGVSADQGLLKEWSKSGPPLRWKVTDLGTGYSAPTVTRGKLFVQTTEGNAELAVALDEKTGKKLWSTKIGQVGVNKGPQYPGTRATPTVDGDKLYCLASDGQLACLTLEGKMVWQKNIKTEFDGEVGNWAYSESLLVDADKVICTPGGKTATLAALNKNTGETVWKSAFPGGDQAEYASIMAIEAAGRKQYVQYLRKALIGVDAKTGEFLWQYTRPGRTEGRGASVSTPVVSGNKIFISGSLVGGGAIELVPDGQGVAVKELYFDKNLTVGYGGAILYKGYIYSTNRTGMYCVEFATGKMKWNERGVGAASMCLADGKIYARGYDSGEIALVEPSPEEYLEISRFKQPERSRIPGWTHPIVANGGFYVRDQNALLCFDVKADKQ